MVDEEGAAYLVVDHHQRLLDKYLNLCVQRPHACCMGGCCTLFLLMVISIVTGSMNMTMDQDTAWAVHTGEFTRYRTALRVAREEAGFGNRRLLGEVSDELSMAEHVQEDSLVLEGLSWFDEQGLLRSITRRLADMGLAEDSGLSPRRLQEEEEKEKEEDLSLFYKVDTGTIFAPKHLQEMCNFEKLIFDGGVCEGKCRIWSASPALLFYGGSLTDCDLLPQATIDSVVAMMSASVALNKSNSVYARLLHPQFESTGTAPLAKAQYKLKKAEKVVFDQMFQQFDPPLSYGFLRSAFMADEDRFAQLSKTSGDLRVRVFYDTDEFGKMLGPDFGLAMFSFIFVFVCMWAHLGSCFMACTGMFQILASLPVSGIIYRKFMMVGYFEFLHILVVYLVLGIGADDIFVFVDSWRHITTDPSFSGDTRAALKTTWVRTAGAVFNTSFTTAVAFLSMSISKVMPMRTCGWYAAVCIFLNYLFTITFTPACLMVYQLRYAGKRNCCPNPASRGEVLNPEARSRGGGCISGVVERFIQKAYLPLMKAKFGPPQLSLSAPGILVAIMLFVGIQGAYFSLQLSPPNKVEEWFPSNHMWTNFTEFVVENSYQPSFTSFDQMHFVWGIQDLGFENFDAYKPDDNPGEPIYEPTFDITTQRAQTRILEVCQMMRDVPCDLTGCKNAGSGKLTLRQGALVGVNCFLEDMQKWHKDSTGSDTLPTGPAFIQLLKDFHDNADPEALGADTHGELIKVNYRRDIGFVDGELKFVSISLRSTLPKFEPYGTGVDVRDLVANWVEQVRGGSPAELKSFKVASGRFASYDLGSELISGLFSGCAIALPISLLVILLSTKNVMLALYAVSAVAFIVMSVLGFCKSAMNWDLGIAEAIAGVIVIGYSIDYVIHLAHIYSEAAQHGMKTREERATFAIENMGSTVFAGAITTAGSGAFMFACFLTFFFKMALLICVTIMYSFLFSLCYFMGLSFFAGPANRQGDIRCCNDDASKDEVKAMTPKEAEFAKSAQASDSKPVQTGEENPVMEEPPQKKEEEKKEGDVWV